MVLKTTFSFETRIRNRDFPLNVRRMAPQNATHLHCHEFTELVIVYDGKGFHATGENKPVELSRGSIIVIPKGVYHQYLDENLSLLNIIFENDLLPLPLLDVYSMPYFNMIFKGNPENPEIFKITEEELKEVLPLTEKLGIELAEHLPGCQFAATALFMQIVIYLARIIGGKVENTRSSHIGISKTIEYIHKHFTEKISIEKLADKAGMSMSSLLRHFKRINGSSPKEYLINLRVNYACELLDTTRLSIDEIAFNAGFNDSNYFSREFRKVTGITPSKYKADRQKKVTSNEIYHKQ
jgi:AraC-like DNA-binding protein